MNTHLPNLRQITPRSFGLLIILLFNLHLLENAVAGDWYSPIAEKYQTRNEVLYGLYKQAQALNDSYGGQARILSQSQDLLDSVIQSDPEFAPAYYELGRILIMRGYIREGQFRNGSVEAAGTTIKRAIQIEPEYAEAYCLLGHLYTKSGDYIPAQRALEQCEAIGTESPWLDLNWADLLIRLGKPEEAHTRFLHVLAEGTSNKKAQSAALKGVRRYYERRGDYAEAERWYRKGLEWNPESAWSWGNYAAFQLYSLGDEEGAIASAERALSIMDYGMARKTMACALYTKWARGQDHGASVADLKLLYSRALSYFADTAAAAKTLGTYSNTRFAAIALFQRLGVPVPYGPGDSPRKGMYYKQPAKSVVAGTLKDPVALWNSGVAERDISLRFHKMTEALEIWSEGANPLEPLQYIDALPPGREQVQFRSMALSNAAVSQPEMMLDRLDLFPNPQQQRQILSTAMNQLGQTNGEAAVERAFRFYAVDQRMTAVRSAYSGWARTDVLAASRHYAGLPNWSEFPAAGQAILEFYMDADEAGALEWATEIEGPGGTILWSRVLYRIAAYRPEEALAIVDQVPASPMTQRGVEKVLEHLAQSHPQIAAKYVEHLSIGQIRANVSTQAANHWAEQDPLSAFEWTLKQPPLIQQGIYRRLIPKLVKSDLQFVLGIPVADLESDVRSIWVSSVLTAYAKIDIEAAEQWLMQYQGESFFEQALNQLVRLKARDDPRSALEQLTSMTDTKHYRRQISEVISIWAMKAPQSAADWIMLNLPHDERITLFRPVLRPWNNHDPASAKRWALGLDDPVERDEALGILYSFEDP